MAVVAAEVVAVEVEVRVCCTSHLFTCCCGTTPLCLSWVRADHQSIFKASHTHKSTSDNFSFCRLCLHRGCVLIGPTVLQWCYLLWRILLRGNVL